jgi:phosphoribosylformylglycinamidine synthase subunit PurQ / glutaminase
MKARVGIVVFPGSNCEQDCDRALRSLGCETQYVWHAETKLPPIDIAVLPGGFAHGDYLRTGAIARFSPIMAAIPDFAAAGGLVIGICNGFQILCEAGLLPGALRKNAGLKFLCRWTELRVENANTPFTSLAEAGQILRIPINHFEGNWFCDPETLESLRSRDRVVLSYVDNPNGSLDDVAGIANDNFTIFGLMPHPERACEAILGSRDGRLIFGSMIEHVTALRSSDASSMAVSR